MVTQVSNREVILLDMNVLFIMHIIKSKEDDIPCLFSPNRSLFKTLPENALALETAGYLPTFAAFVWCFSFDFILRDNLQSKLKHAYMAIFCSLEAIHFRHVTR